MQIYINIYSNYVVAIKTNKQINYCKKMETKIYIKEKKISKIVNIKIASVI